MFPTHNFPTDRSLHFNTNAEWGSHKNFFDETSVKRSLNGEFTRFRITLNPEYQPSREFSIGAYINFDSLSASSGGQTIGKSGLSDQFFYGEYRFIDEPGYSFGFATVFKVPIYSAPSEAPTQAILLLGDGQIDAAFMFTSEFWIQKNFRFNADLGFNFRTDDHASEIPMLLSVQYVKPKYNVGVNLNGNLSLRNDKTNADAVAAQIRTFAGAGNYVYALNPQILKLEVKGEYAFSHAWAVNLKMVSAVYGSNAPQETNYSAGVSYRYFDPKQRKRSYKEVDLETDDTGGAFDGEIQEGDTEEY